MKQFEDRNEKKIHESVCQRNSKMEKFLKDCSPLLDHDIQKGLEDLLEGIHMTGIDDSVEFLLETFCAFFVQKGIVTVEYCDYEKDMQEKHMEI